MFRFAAAATLALSCLLATPRAGHANEFEGVRLDFRPGFDLVTDPQSFSGRQITLPCVFLRATLEGVRCPVFNLAGDFIGDVGVDVKPLGVEDRRFLLNECRQSEYRRRCFAEVTAKVYVGTYDVIILREPTLLWRRD